MAKAKADTELLVNIAIQRAKLGRLDYPVTVQLIWYAPDLGDRDTDGMYPMIKAVIDALVKKDVLKNDSQKFVHQSLCGPIVVSRDQPRFEVCIRRCGCMAEVGSVCTDRTGHLLPRAGGELDPGQEDLPAVPGAAAVPGRSAE